MEGVETEMKEEKGNGGSGVVVVVEVEWGGSTGRFSENTCLRTGAHDG